MMAYRHVDPRRRRQPAEASGLDDDGLNDHWEAVFGLDYPNDRGTAPAAIRTATA